ncbi:GTPase activating protein Rap1-GAP [Pelomyxa schiedti]|nr:GTPase activating protein Rap1-GAP [Pelomyxa schiedti]
MSIHGTLPVASWTAQQVVAWVSSLGPPFNVHAHKFTSVSGQQLEDLKHGTLMAKPFSLTFPQARQLLDKREDVKKRIANPNIGAIPETVSPSSKDRQPETTMCPEKPPTQIEVTKTPTTQASPPSLSQSSPIQPYASTISTLPPRSVSVAQLTSQPSTTSSNKTKQLAPETNLAQEPTTSTKLETAVTPAKSETPITPTTQAKSVTPAAPAKSETPTTPTKPETPATPAKTETPAAPVKSDIPAKPETLTIPAKLEPKAETPTAPAKSETPTAPLKSETPSKPEVPLTPTKPEMPLTPAKSEPTSVTPATHAKSEIHVVPTTPTKSETPTKSGTSTSPTKPTTPEKYETPTKPVKPETTTTPAKPKTPETPTKPELHVTPTKPVALSGPIAPAASATLEITGNASALQPPPVANLATSQHTADQVPPKELTQQTKHLSQESKETTAEQVTPSHTAIGTPPESLGCCPVQKSSPLEHKLDEATPPVQKMTAVLMEPKMTPSSEQATPPVDKVTPSVEHQVTPHVKQVTLPSLENTNPLVEQKVARQRDEPLQKPVASLVKEPVVSPADQKIPHIGPVTPKEQEIPLNEHTMKLNEKTLDPKFTQPSKPLPVEHTIPVVESTMIHPVISASKIPESLPEHNKPQFAVHSAPAETPQTQSTLVTVHTPSKPKDCVETSSLSATKAKAGIEREVARELTLPDQHPPTACVVPSTCTKTMINSVHEKTTEKSSTTDTAPPLASVAPSHSECVTNNSAEQCSDINDPVFLLVNSLFQGTAYDHTKQPAEPLLTPPKPNTTEPPSLNIVPPQETGNKTSPMPAMISEDHSCTTPTHTQSTVTPPASVYEPTPESDPTYMSCFACPDSDSDSEADEDWRFDADSDAESHSGSGSDSDNDVKAEKQLPAQEDEQSLEVKPQNVVAPQLDQPIEIPLPLTGSNGEHTPSQYQSPSPPLDGQLPQTDLVHEQENQDNDIPPPSCPPDTPSTYAEASLVTPLPSTSPREELPATKAETTLVTTEISHDTHTVSAESNSASITPKVLPPPLPTAPKPMHSRHAPGKPLPAAPIVRPPTSTTESITTNPSTSPDTTSVILTKPTATDVAPIPAPEAAALPVHTTSTAPIVLTTSTHVHISTNKSDAPRRKPKKDEFVISGPTTFKHAGHLGAAMESWGTGASLRDQPMPVAQTPKSADTLLKFKNISSMISEPVGSVSTKLRKNLALFQSAQNLTIPCEAIPPVLPTKIIHDHSALVSAIKAMEPLQWGSKFVDHWTSTTYPNESWTGAEPNTEMYGIPAIDVACTTPKGGAFAVEYDARSVTSTKRDEIEPFGFYEPHRYFLFYKEFFFGQKHDIYCCISEGSPIIVAIQHVEGKEISRRVMIFSKKGMERVLIPSSESARFVGSDILHLKDTKLVRIKAQADLSKDLLNFEERSCVRAYKFGVLWVKPNQTDENDIFSNLEADSTPRYREFLDFIGTKVALEGWTHYRAGLDVKTGSTGQFSVYTTLREYEIMYHVCTYLPFQRDDTQRVERKRHIGNDVVTLIFKERDPTNPNDLFTPKLLTSHFLHGFFVVEPVVDSATNLTTEYKITIANKAGVSPYPPFMPEPLHFPKNEQTRDWLLLKLINSERTALVQSPEFRGMMTARKGSLMNVCKTYMSKKDTASL